MWKAIFINDWHVAFSTISPGKKEEEGKSRRKFRAEAFARNYGSIFIFESKWLQKLPEQLLIAVGGSNSSGSCSQENSRSHIISFCMHVDPSATQLLRLYSCVMCLLGKCHQFDAERPSCINMHNGQEPWDAVTLTERLSATNNNVCVAQIQPVTWVFLSFCFLFFLFFCHFGLTCQKTMASWRWADVRLE